MKKRTVNKLKLNKAQISKLENVTGGAHDAAAGGSVIDWLRSCLGGPCKNTEFIICVNL